MKSFFCRTASRVPSSLALALASCICFCLLPSAWGGADPSGSQISGSQPSEGNTATIPGPLSSFRRMAAISQKVPPEDVLPFLAHNVFTNSLVGLSANGRPAEFIVLLTQYLQQARELQAMADPEGVLRVSGCDQAKPLLTVLGYRFGGNCGQPKATLETANPQRAFLTVDSGFPLSELERALQQGQPFTYPFAESRVAVLFQEGDWTTKEQRRDSQYLVNRLLLDGNLARLYWAVSRLDTETQLALRQSPGLGRLAPVAPVLDFYGTHIRIHGGRVLVPGGPDAEPAWKSLVGEDPKSPGNFVLQLLAKDKGWLAVYFDALSRVDAAQQAHLVEPHRLRRFYEALRESDVPPDPARPVFRPDSGILLLATRMRWEPDGQPYVPGNLEAWKNIFRQRTASKMVREWGKRAARWTKADQLLESLFALSRLETDSGPLQIYLTLNELDRRRSPQQRLSPETVALLASKFPQYSRQYLIFSEFPSLNGASIASFLKVADSLSGVSNQALRGNAFGVFQANVGLWQILARQGQIPNAELNESWQRVVRPFAKITTSTTLFDAALGSLSELMLAAGKSTVTQEEILDLLAGPRQSQPAEQSIHRELADRMRSVLEEQRLVSLDTILELGKGLQSVDAVESDSAGLLALAAKLQEFQMPQPIFKRGERDQWATGIYNNHHTDLQMRTNLAKIIKSPESSERVAEARGQLAQFLRDILVGLNYAYYNPPGGQMLHHNPLFVRSHDFSGETYANGSSMYPWQSARVFGVGFPAGGGAHLVGSLADLPYILAKAEQDFIAPENVQSLIWQAVVPGLLTNAVVPRWWSVSPNELHAVALHQRAGEELLQACMENAKLREDVIAIVADRMPPRRTERLDRDLRSGRWGEALQQLSPGDTFYLAAEFRRKFPYKPEVWGPSGVELQNLTERYPNEVEWQRLSNDFGVPHPVLTQSYAREFVNLEPFPAFSGDSSRLLAESWDSNNLYWARLADEQGYSPVMLNLLVPQLTHRMVEKISATDIEDWPALGRAAWETGEEFRRGKMASPHVGAGNP